MILYQFNAESHLIVGMRLPNSNNLGITLCVLLRIKYPFIAVFALLLHTFFFGFRFCGSRKAFRVGNYIFLKTLDHEKNKYNFFVFSGMCIH